MLFSDEDFIITITVKVGQHTYEITRSGYEDGCKYFENIPSKADYMGRAIRKQIELDKQNPITAGMLGKTVLPWPHAR